MTFRQRLKAAADQREAAPPPALGRPVLNLGGRVDLRDCKPCNEKLLAAGKAIVARNASGGTVLFFRRKDYRVGPHDKWVASLRASGYEVVESFLQAHRGDVKAFATKFEEMVALVEDMDAPPVAVVRWEEHGRLFVNETWRLFCQWAHDHGIPALMLDYAYFDHYKAYSLDCYLPSGESAIEADWPHVPPRLRWSDADARTQTYVARIREDLDKAALAGPLEDPGYVLFWPSFTISLARKAFHLNGVHRGRRKSEWLAKVCDAITGKGYRVVVKKGTVGGGAPPDGVTWYEGSDPLVNARLALYAANNVVLCSSVTNELTIWGLPVTALGRSWFVGKGIFHEPGSWDEVGPPAPINREARVRWQSWWLGQIGYVDQAADLLGRRVREFHARRAGGVDYAAIYEPLHELKGARYGADRQTLGEVKAALQAVRPDSVLDIGCGRGELVQWWAGRGVPVRGLDIAEIAGRQPADAYDVGDARALPYGDRSYDLVTMCDLLEHLEEEEDVGRALFEARRVGRRLFAVICTREARTQGPNGENLHLTVKERKWWKIRLQEAGWKPGELRQGGDGRVLLWAK